MQDSADIEKVEKLHAELERQVTEVTQSDVNAEASDTMLSASGKQQQEEIVAKLENLKQLKNRRMVSSQCSAAASAAACIRC